ncbi:phage endonuclease [Secundilactobacillus pentosiphilus]|uniref:Phage endonuclease n=1 Tax=Secundilactobacillus pentosiphilus TaxID=1714682 RepID=A0A1Z5IS10_9LACO|nr:NUMOD4 motif-containing HNH endonuclease [Secundilactobacillus pentosiphilus]GAX04563.1 phage endonuclease [Secundilactobacillus pentosiphilus]
MENWKWIAGYEGKYKVSDAGRVLSFANTSKSHLLSNHRLNKDGYIHVSLRKNNIATEYLLNRIVAQTFIGNPPVGKDTVNHINGIKTDNRIENLEWASRSEQMYHAYKHHLKIPVKPKDILLFSEKQKEYIKSRYVPYKHGRSINYFAKKFNVCHAVIEEIISEK